MYKSNTVEHKINQLDATKDILFPEDINTTPFNKKWSVTKI